MKNIKDYEAMAKLNLPEQEREWVLNNANMLEASFAALAEVDTENTEPLVTVLELTNVLREDVSSKMLPRADVLSNAPEQNDGYFQVPKTIE